MPEFSTEIQSEHFCGDDYLLIEGVAFIYYKKYYNRNVLTKNIVDALIG